MPAWDDGRTGWAGLHMDAEIIYNSFNHNAGIDTAQPTFLYNVTRNWMKIRSLLYFMYFKSLFTSIRNRKMQKIIFLTLAIFFTPLSVFADGQSNWYLGAKGGTANVEDCGDEEFSCDAKKSTSQIFGGYQFNENFAAELGYSVLPSARFSSTPSGAGNIPFSGNIKIRGWNLDLVGTLPLGNNWSVFGKLGVFSGEAKTNIQVSTLSSSQTDRSHEPHYGFGVSYKFNPNISVSGEVERFRLKFDDGEKTDVDTFMVGIKFNF